MSVDRSSRPSLSSLRREAKSLLDQAGRNQPEALALIREHHPVPDDFATDRDALLVVARKYGHPGWWELQRAFEEEAGVSGTLEDLADLFAELACLSYRGDDHVSRRERAARMLGETPGISWVHPWAAAAASDVEALRQLTRDADSAVAPGGPRHWPPLLYLCFSRVPEDGPRRDALAAAELLLASGAPGDTCVGPEERGGWSWSALTGVMGEGEHGLLQQPPHPRARELAAILLDAGADPNDAQGLYNTMFTPDNQWLELLLSRGLEAAAVVYPSHDPPLRTLDYQLSQAVKRGFPERVSLLLEHGADVTVPDLYKGRSNYENAVLGGFPEIAEMLARHGAEVVELSLEDRFTAAVMSGDEGRANQLLAEAPGLIENPELLQEAVTNAAATRLLLDLGADPDAPNERGRVSLHWAAWENSGEVVRLLLARGASCEIRERDHDATPVGFANHAGHFELRDLLLDHSRDVFDLTAWGRVEQLAAVLESDPALAKARLAAGHTPVHGVTASPEGEQVLDLLLAHGADIDAATDDGTTPLSAALGRGDEELAALLRARGASEAGGG